MYGGVIVFLIIDFTNSVSCLDSRKGFFIDDIDPSNLHSSNTIPLKSVSVPSELACSQKCFGNELCSYKSYDSKSGNCQLYKQISSDDLKQKNKVSMKVNVRDVCDSKDCGSKSPIKAAFKHCQEAYTQGFRFTGVYHIHVGQTLFFDVPCEMETDGGGWIVFQRRVDASVDFYRNWKEYKTGFGDLNGNYWLGLERIHKLAGPGQGAILRVDLKHMSKPDELKYAEYSTFKISDENNEYTLTISGYSGDAGNSLGFHNGKNFSTKDFGQTANCAITNLGAWWYNKCLRSNLNGLFPTPSSKGSKYMSWYYLHSSHGGIIYSEMKIRYLNP